eukprot:1901026-Rhodomonas_salina.7
MEGGRRRGGERKRERRGELSNAKQASESACCAWGRGAVLFCVDLRAFEVVVGSGFFQRRHLLCLRRHHHGHLASESQSVTLLDCNAKTTPFVPQTNVNVSTPHKHQHTTRLGHARSKSYSPTSRSQPQALRSASWPVRTQLAPFPTQLAGP